MSKRSFSADSIIGVQCEFNGSLRLEGNLQINGKYSGDELVLDMLTVGEHGRVKSDISANHVVVEGLVIGGILAKEKVLLMSTARVLGDITTPELIIQDGVIFEGQCHIRQDLKASAKKMLENLFNEDSKKQNLISDE